MTQPAFVPIGQADQVRSALRLQVPAPWAADRPAETRPGPPPHGRSFGNPGPDQGYALRLARRLAPSLILDGESLDDVLAGLALLGARRAGLFGRAPAVHDLHLAAWLWQFTTDEVEADLLAARRHAFGGVAHDYTALRTLVNSVPESTLRLSPEQVRSRAPTEWRALTSHV